MRAIRRRVRQLADLGPAASDHAHAARVAIGLVVPGLAIVLAGRPDLLIYAVFGSFVGMYGRTESPAGRIRHQGQAALILGLAAGIGVELSNHHVGALTLVVAEMLFAGISSVAADTWGLKPEGPFFGIFALGAMATLPSGHVSPTIAVAIGGSTALFCVTLSVVIALRTGDLRSFAGLRRTSSLRAIRPYTTAETLTHAVRYVMAISLAGAGGLALGIDHANWAMAASAVPLAAPDARGGDRSIHGVVQRGVHRVLGTFGGLAITGALLAPHPGPTFLAVVVIVLLFPTELFMIHHYGLALGFFTPLIMLMTELAEPTDALTLVRDRAIDTFIGVVIGIGVAVISRRWGRRRTTPAEVPSPG